MLEAINRICQLSEELTKATIIIDNKDRQIQEMDKALEDQRTQIETLRSQLNQAQGAKRDPIPHPPRGGNLEQ